MPYPRPVIELAEAIANSLNPPHKEKSSSFKTWEPYWGPVRIKRKKALTMTPSYAQLAELLLNKYHVVLIPKEPQE